MTASMSVPAIRETKMAIVTYEHHGVTVFVEEKLKGTHRDHCLCFKCDSFKPGSPENCSKAQRLYQLCVDEGMTTPVFECPVYRPIKPFPIFA